MVFKGALSIDELGKLTGLLDRYLKELIFEAADGARMDEDPHDTEVRQVAMDKVSDCLDVVKDDFFYRLNN